MAIIEAIKCVLAGIKVGFQAFFSVLPLYKELSDLNDKIIAAGLGIPIAIVSIGGTAIFLIKLVSKFVRR